MADPAQILNQIAPHNLLASLFTGAQQMGATPIAGQVVESARIVSGRLNTTVDQMIAAGNPPVKILQPATPTDPAVFSQTTNQQGPRPGTRFIKNVIYVGFPGQSSPVQYLASEVVISTPGLAPPPRRGRRIRSLRD